MLRILLYFFVCIGTGISTTHALANSNILILGDSLSAAYGIKTETSWPVLLQQQLSRDGFPHQVYNASISGQTSSEGLQQIDQLLKLSQPILVIVELGANDGLRGLSTQAMQQNLQSLIAKSLQAKAQVLLLGIRVPANYGRRYSAMFDSAFQQLAKQNPIEFIPFLLAPLTTIITDDNRSLYIQTDGLHPTELAQPLLLQHIYPAIQSLIK